MNLNSYMADIMRSLSIMSSCLDPLCSLIMVSYKTVNTRTLVVSGTHTVYECVSEKYSEIL